MPPARLSMVWIVDRFTRKMPAIVLAVVASIIDHLRTSYAPHNTILESDTARHWCVAPASPRRRTAGLDW